MAQDPTALKEFEFDIAREIRDDNAKFKEVHARATEQLGKVNQAIQKGGTKEEIEDLKMLRLAYDAVSTVIDRIRG